MISIEHVHPMVVHFPIVLFLLVLAMDIVIVARGGDLAGRDCLANTALSALVLGAIAAAVAATFGDMAFDIARAKGFPAAPLDRHADLGYTTMWFFIVFAAARLLAWWRRVPLRGGRGWAVALVGVVGVALLITTAYFGGELVYELGVNVAAVKP